MYAQTRNTDVLVTLRVAAVANLLRLCLPVQIVGVFSSSQTELSQRNCVLVNVILSRSGIFPAHSNAALSSSPLLSSDVKDQRKVTLN